MARVNRLYEMDSSFPRSGLLKMFLIGFISYTVGFTMSVTENPVYVICDLIRLIGIGLMTLSFVQVLSFRFENRYLKILYSLYIFWLFTVVIRGLEPNYEFVKNALFDPLSGVFLYFAPLILLIPKPPKFYGYVFSTAIVLGIFFLIHIGLGAQEFLDNKNLEGRERFEVFVKVLALPCGFLLMTFNYHQKKTRIIALIVVGIGFLLALYHARRGLIFITGCVFIFSFLMFLYLNKRKLLLLIFSLLTGSLVLIYTITTLNITDSKIFSKTKERVSEDTRSGVEDFYYADMQFKDWMIGRGMSGMVAAPIGIEIDNPTPGYRKGIETDYLNIILKGGIISLGLLLLIAIPAVIQGLFLSKNTISKAAAFWIILWMISLYPSTVTTFSLNYILVWIAIGICYSKSTRNMPDDILKDYFLSRQKTKLS